MPLGSASDASEARKRRKVGSGIAAAISIASKRSASCVAHLGTRWTLFSISQWPFDIAASNAREATRSCPWPIEISMKSLPFCFPCFCARRATSAATSTPAVDIRKTGAKGVESTKAS
eukprot:scaffold3349_cov246-Pinguiococcus_pyrenoidosus.AAC.9